MHSVISPDILNAVKNFTINIYNNKKYYEHSSMSDTPTNFVGTTS